MKELTENIKNSTVYKQVLADSFGGVMYDVSNRNKYDADNIIQLWDQLTAAQKGASGGIMKGALEFLKEERT